MNRICLACYQPVLNGNNEFHEDCSKKLFLQNEAPVLAYTEKELARLGLQIIRSSISVTGVQPKLSLDIEKERGNQASKRFTIVGLWGQYILKPPSLHYPQLPETEDLTMHLAEIAGIPVVPHSLIRLASGSFAYITRRIDRIKGSKIHMEDMCQITGKLTEEKYQGSYEQVAKAILQYSSFPVLDAIGLCEVLLFSFVTGNADMHLKNFSIIRTGPKEYRLTPAYDLVSTALVNPADKEELALTLNGKKNKITREDFIRFFERLAIEPQQQERLFSRIEKSAGDWYHFIRKSFLTREYQESFITIIRERMRRLNVS
ncbi:MAG: hypothetical protein FMNOHCHN_00236 [Ignavibacteriaceae bacterium]|nr:hypothetical protein [Ignavibacteriaceae bacterium]